MNDRRYWQYLVKFFELYPDPERRMKGGKYTPNNLRRDDRVRDRRKAQIARGECT